ncbi:MAG: hypothetical protein FWD60_06045 [Candidatus Azobacteroides sp.]|nr:hypothetical protein [Candidatus Azobacteroides sp.]
MKTTIFKILFCCGLLTAMAGCSTSESDGNHEETPSTGISKVMFTECNDNQTLKAETNGNNVVVEFTAAGVHITHYGLAVTCDFDTVLVNYTLKNGVLNITEKGDPHNTRCICHTDVSYTIQGISESDINSIIINEEEVWTSCKNPLSTEFWAWIDVPNLEYNKVFVVNSYDEMHQHPYFANSEIPYTIDFTTQSVLITYGSACQICDIKSAFSTTNGYRWDVFVYHNSDVMCFRAVPLMVMKVVDKIPSDAPITFTVTDESGSCGSDGNVLMLKVDFLTNTFEGGYEYSFDNAPNSFTITTDYLSPGDFGYIKLFYSEINEMLFYGTIVWMGCGKIYFPTDLLSANNFDRVLTDDYVFPANGFENLFPESSFYPETGYEPIWSSVQSLVKVREYLHANPQQKVQLFLYTPSVGVGDPADWDWILFLKK